MKRHLIKSLILILLLSGCGMSGDTNYTDSAQTESAQSESGIPDTSAIQEEIKTNILSDDYPPDNEEKTSSTDNSSNMTSVDENTSSNESQDTNNFDTYNNEMQQQTSDTYVLNENSKKIHHPSCSSVPKISPENYATSSLAIDELISQGYSTCGNCFK